MSPLIVQCRVVSLEAIYTQTEKRELSKLYLCLCIHCIHMYIMTIIKDKESINLREEMWNMGRVGQLVPVKGQREKRKEGK